MAKYQSYPEYKDSGVEWLDLVPLHWGLNRMDDIAAIQRTQIAPRDLQLEEVIHYSIPSIQQFGIGQSEMGESIDSNKFIVQAYDVLFSKLNPRKKTIVIVQEHDHLIVASTEFVVLRPKFADQKYLKYLLLSSELHEFICSQVESATKSHQRINPDVVAKLKFPVPPLSERNAIANFLDHETAKIDTLIEKQQQLIQLLKEKRQAVISHAVTKGLNPHAPMKDSGVEWLGQVPEHWLPCSLKHYASVIDCKHITAEFLDDGFPLASISEVKEWFVNLASAKFTSERFYQDLIGGGRKPVAGDIIYSRNATVGEAALVTSDMPDFAMGQDVCLIRLEKELSPEYIMYVLKSPVVLRQLELAMVGSTFKRINVDDIRNFSLAMPPIDEQIEIVEQLKFLLTKYDRVICSAQDSIFLMQERRTALISAAVTGKIDVRNWQAPTN